MSEINKIFIITILLIISCHYLQGKPNLDSSLRLRENTYNEYDQMMKEMEKRTWLNLVRVNQKASEVILLDNELINNYLLNEIEKNNLLKTETDKLKTENIYLKKEAKIQNMLIEERKFLTTTLLIIIGAASLLFLTFLILFIDRQIRYRSAKIESEKLLAEKNEIKAGEITDDSNIKLKRQITELKEKREYLESQIKELKKQNLEKDETIAKEIKGRTIVEEEIKNLISLIKKR